MNPKTLGESLDLLVVSVFGALLRPGFWGTLSVWTGAALWYDLESRSDKGE